MLSVCAEVQLAAPGGSCQSANELPCAVSASRWPAGPTASVAVHRGSAGSARQDAPGPATPPVPKDADSAPPAPGCSGADSSQCPPPSFDHAVRMVAAGPAPDSSTVWGRVPSVAILSTSTARPAVPPVSAAGTTGPAACQRPPVSAKIPAVPVRPHRPASIGAPEPLNAAAVRPVSPQARPAGVLASDAALASLAQDAPRRAPSSAPPPWVRASSWPPGPAARASGTSARPGLTRAPDDQ